MSVNSTSPASLFGGTWERLQDKFLLGAGSYSETNGNEGGDATHTLTADEMPKHSHNINYSIASSHTQQAAGFLHNPETHSGFSGEGTYAVWSQSVGKGTPHNNMPPYLAVYMWQRTA
jgi:microcystin-dependent protein